MVAASDLVIISPGPSVVLPAPEHVGIAGAAGWSKAQVELSLYPLARRRTADLGRVKKASKIPAEGPILKQPIVIENRAGAGADHSTSS